ncbi:hypothetical protein ACSI5N_25375 (plasmid) [Raoultella ornithinolytica]|uniref:hypothetical protein n=1 Tax=Raoultella ornithinolytica TaxID=54291 RepID=UPI00292A7EFD|nr:hypothetical protein [Raoultella ornithinolytica]MDV1094957.1 hypothetical protein [Raoultella ornithinolytica]MDV1122699.1 hypothetical protein [Raoultella ornithinolytica]MDV1893214.1 hypothetical protein [Raoultella ornithinolytica]
MTPAEILENVKKRFNPLLVREEETLESFLRKALAAYQDRAGVITAIKLEKVSGTSVTLPDDYLALVQVIDANGTLVYADDLGGMVELEPMRSDRWPFRMLYLMNLRDRPFDSWQVPPAIVGMIEDYLETLINVRNVARQRRASIDGKFDYSDLPDEATLYMRVVEIEEKMSSNRAIIPGATIIPGIGGCCGDI